MRFTLPTDLEAHEPPEARGLARDGVRLLVGEVSTGAISHHRFTDLPDVLRAGDVLVVNTSGTLPAAVQVVGAGLAVHFSTGLAGGEWLVELRSTDGKASKPYHGGVAGQRLPLPGGGAVTLRERYSRDRLWRATVDSGGGSVTAFLRRYGQPIRYSYVPRPWPLPYYQTVFATEPGSAEMPSAARPFSEHLVTRLVAAGVLIAPVLLHAGVASPEAHERPYPEWFDVSATTARVVAEARAAGRRIIAVGTTAVRALESAVGADGVPRASSGWTDLVVTVDHGVRVVDGLLTGFHEPRASHLDLLETIAGSPLLDAMYEEALRSRYLWHEFGDTNLILP
ncbi:S-adenosylmethionine:tRNA ribosyltransferase-isomerase [Phytohabitans aurantiacus]|uniref:S-adenosylmethionine:tRNA ribosyltransferase-isomerase n=1 Tax=Phytohabitans aurantiacus TaxID=3016789 RepID=A0ABQ5QUX2_9ACTN|nr:S-adenosylmethionine:tRNA ribosyltransferase-isomerase [Phytohabitans aurantiacus]GLH98380.1 S-adenosylmethionine:tRNA ribosyltransferase-isomerase [Phytohabitans aurantiacus]